MTKKIDLEENPNFIVTITEDVISVNWDDAYRVNISEKNLQKKSKPKITFS
jgi:hypothetical protein